MQMDHLQSPTLPSNSTRAFFARVSITNLAHNDRRLIGCREAFTAWRQSRTKIDIGLTSILYHQLTSGCEHPGIKHDHLVRLPLIGPGGFEATVAQRQGWQYEQIERHRCQKAAENNDGHWSLNLAAGIIAAQRQRQNAKPGHK